MGRWTSIAALVGAIAFASPAGATCNKTATVTASPTSVDVDTEQTSQHHQDYTIHVVNADDQGCASRQFCFYQSLITNQPGAVGLLDSHLDITPTGDWICIGLLPADSTDFTIGVEQDHDGTTPAHRYQVYGILRSGPTTGSPLVGSTVVTYNRHDQWGNTCKVP